MGLFSKNAADPTPQHGEKFATTHEFLWKHFADAYKLEADQRESIWRSIPGFVTALGFYGAVFGFVVGKKTPFDCGDFTSWIFYALVIASAISAFSAFILLSFLLLPRTYKALAWESEILTYVDETIAIQQWKIDNENLSQDEANGVSLKALNRILVEDYATAISHNREINRQRYQARGISAALLLSAYILVVIPAFAAAWALP